MHALRRQSTCTQNLHVEFVQPRRLTGDPQAHSSRSGAIVVGRAQQNPQRRTEARGVMKALGLLQRQPLSTHNGGAHRRTAQRFVKGRERGLGRGRSNHDRIARPGARRQKTRRARVREHDGLRSGNPTRASEGKGQREAAASVVPKQLDEPLLRQATQDFVDGVEPAGFE